MQCQYFFFFFLNSRNGTINKTEIIVKVYLFQEDMSLVVRKPVFGVPTRSDTNQAVQLQKMARGLKFRI